MTQNNLQPEAFIEDVHPSVTCLITRMGQVTEINADNLVGYELYQQDRVTVKNDFVKLRFLYSGNSIILEANSKVPGEANSYLIEKDVVPSFYSKVRESLFNFFQGTSKIQKATYPPLVTKGVAESDRKTVFPPDNCRVQRSDSLIFAWSKELLAPILEITWNPNGRTAKEPDDAECKLKISNILKRGGFVPEEEEITFNWCLTDTQSEFRVEGKICVLKGNENIDIQLMEGLTQNEKIRWQVGYLVQNQFYIEARKTILKYKNEAPAEFENSLFLQKSAQFLKLIADHY